MKFVHVLDAQGLYIESTELQPVGFDDDNPIYEYPEYYTEVKLPTETNGFYRAKWTGTKWVEDAGDEEIEELLNAPRELTELEKLRMEQAQANAELVQLIMTIGGA